MQYRKGRTPILLRAGILERPLDDDGMVLRVEVDNLSNGEELCTEEWDLLFQPGFKSHSASPQSDGEGLSSVRNVVVAAGGSVWMKSLKLSCSIRTIFVVELPACHNPGVCADYDGLRHRGP